MKNCNPCENRFPPYIPDGDCCDKHHHHHHPDMPPVPSVCEGEDLYEAMNRLSDRVNVCIHTYNEVMHNAYKTLRNLECAAQKVGAYYSDSEVSVEDGYNTDMRATYQVIRIKPFDAHGCPIRVELGLAYNNTTNSGILQSITSKSDVVLADKIAVAIENSRNMGYSWYGSVVYKGAPLPSNTELGNNRWTVGFTKHGTMKVYSNVNSSAEKLIADGIVNAMGCNNILVKNGEKTDMSERDGSTYSSSKQSRVAMGQIDSTKEMIFVAVSKENDTDRQGMTSEELQTIMYNLGCYVAVQLCEREYAQMLDKGGELIQSPEYEPDADAPAFWYITRKPYYTNDFQDEIGHLTQNYQSVVRKNQANEGQIRNMALSLSNLTSRVETIESNSETWNQHFNKIDSDITKINNEIDALKAKDSELNNDIDTLESSLNTLTTRVETNESGIASNLKEIKTLKTNDSMQDTFISTLQSDVSKAKSDISSLQSFQSTAESDISSIKQKNTEQDSSISTNTENIATNTSDISSIKEKNTEQDSEIAALKLKDTSLEGSIDTIQNSITTINGEVTALNNTVDSVNNSISNLNSSVSSLSTTVNSLGDSVVNLNEVISQHTATLSSLGSKDMEHDSAIQTLTSNVDNIVNGTTKLDYLPATTENNDDYTVSANSVNFTNGIKVNDILISSLSSESLSINNHYIVGSRSISATTPLKIDNGLMSQVSTINYFRYLSSPRRFNINFNEFAIAYLIWNANTPTLIFYGSFIKGQSANIDISFKDVSDKALFWDIIKNTFDDSVTSTELIYICRYGSDNQLAKLTLDYSAQTISFTLNNLSQDLPSGNYILPFTLSWDFLPEYHLPPYSFE